jgi:predicted DNA-binding transcriptional regulator AlpA
MMRQSRDVPLNILIDEKTAATQLSISLHTLRHWRRQGRGPQYVKLGSAIRYRPQDIERWVEERAQPKTRR